MNIKEEKEDDAELLAMVDEIISRNKQEVVDNNQKNLTGTTCNLFPSTLQPVVSNPIDVDSIHNHFGWEIIGNNPIPYITRSGVKYCSLRMFKINVIKKYLDCLHEEILECVHVTNYNVTDNEIKLLNEINEKHCNYQFGKELFTCHDLIVEVNEAINLYYFLSWCYMSIVNRELVEFRRAGFIYVGIQTLIPYIEYNNKKYTPLFFYEGDIQILRQKAVEISGWDLSYLQFLFKIQKVKNEYLPNDSCFVVNLTDIQNLFPPGTSFQEYWPREKAARLLIKNDTRRPTITNALPSSTVPSVSNPFVPSFFELNEYRRNSQLPLNSGFPSHEIARQSNGSRRNSQLSSYTMRQTNEYRRNNQVPYMPSRLSHGTVRQHPYQSTQLDSSFPTYSRRLGTLPTQTENQQGFDYEMLSQDTYGIGAQYSSFIDHNYSRK